MSLVHSCAGDGCGFVHRKAAVTHGETHRHRLVCLNSHSFLCRQPLWQVPTASVAIEGASALNRVRWAQGGKEVAVGDSEGRIWIYDVGEVHIWSVLFCFIVFFGERKLACVSTLKTYQIINKTFWATRSLSMAFANFHWLQWEFVNTSLGPNLAFVSMPRTL